MKTKLPTCSDVARHVCEQLDADINSHKCRQIKRHLERCPNCTAYLDSLKKTVRLYVHYRNPRVPAGSRKRLFAVLKLSH